MDKYISYMSIRCRPRPACHARSAALSPPTPLYACRSPLPLTIFALLQLLIELDAQLLKAAGTGAAAAPSASASIADHASNGAPGGAAPKARLILETQYDVAKVRRGGRS